MTESDNPIKKPFQRKAPNPRAYWHEQAKRLARFDPQLYLEVQKFKFNMYSGAAITYGHQLGDRIIATVGNEYDYAVSTVVRRMHEAIQSFSIGAQRIEKIGTTVQDLVDKVMKQPTGFALIVWSRSDEKSGATMPFQYTSNGDRDVLAVAFKALLSKWKLDARLETTLDASVPTEKDQEHEAK